MSRFWSIFHFPLIVRFDFVWLDLEQGNVLIPSQAWKAEWKFTILTQSQSEPSRARVELKGKKTLAYILGSGKRSRYWKWMGGWMIDGQKKLIVSEFNFIYRSTKIVFGKLKVKSVIFLRRNSDFKLPKVLDCSSLSLKSPQGLFTLALKCLPVNYHDLRAQTWILVHLLLCWFQLQSSLFLLAPLGVSFRG